MIAAHAARAPVPFVTYLAMFGGALLGALTGFLYSAIIVGDRVSWIGPLFAVIFEAWLGSRVARGRLGRPLSSDQRIRIALWYTGVVGAVQALAAWFLLAKSQSPALAHFTGVRGAMMFAVVLVLVFAAVALFRYLLLTLFSSLPGPRKEARA